jgi:hypothetical protein
VNERKPSRGSAAIIKISDFRQISISFKSPLIQIEAASVGGLIHFNQTGKGRKWQVTDKRTQPPNGRFWVHSGHWSRLKQNASVAIDPSATLSGRRSSRDNVELSGGPPAVVHPGMFLI